MNRLSPWFAIATLAGLAIGLYVLGRVGLADVVGIVERIGIGGFLLFVAAQGIVLWALGIAWARSAPERLRPVALFAWARTVREAANELLPFSQLGGLVLGLRVVLAGGAPPARLYAATVIDSLTEIASQILYVLVAIGLAGLLLTHPTPAGVTTAAWVGLALLATLVGGLVILQRPLLRVAGRAATRFVPAAQTRIDEVQAELAIMARLPMALLASFAANFVAWLLSAATSWFALRLLGFATPLPWVVALEGLISVVRSGAFLIPGALGAQEAGYAVLAPLVGLPPEATLALSLLKRARELAIGVPSLLVWQAIEGRRARR